MYTEEIYNYQKGLFMLLFSKHCFDKNIPLARLADSQLKLIDPSLSIEEVGNELVQELFLTIPSKKILYADEAYEFNDLVDIDQLECSELSDFLEDLKLKSQTEYFSNFCVIPTPLFNVKSVMGDSDIYYSKNKNYIGWVCLVDEEVMEFLYDAGSFHFSNLISDVFEMNKQFKLINSEEFNNEMDN